MQAARKIESMCVSRDESLLFCGDLSGFITTFDTDSLTRKSSVLAHSGTIIAMAGHSSEDWFACLSMDRSISMWEYSDKGEIHPIAAASIRNLSPNTDLVPYRVIQSNSQALCVHPTKRRLLTRTGNGAVAELELVNKRFDVKSCFRMSEASDVICLRYVPNDDGSFLCGYGDGHIFLSRHDGKVKSWRVGQESIHWIEPISDVEFLLASDARVIARLNIETNEITIGTRFAADDIEHVAYNKESKRAFASSFDRNIYEVDVDNCNPIGKVLEAPFKCRWIHTFATNPECLLVQCRDGSVLKTHTNSGKINHYFRETPITLWTAAQRKNSLFLAGEGSSLVRYNFGKTCKSNLEPNWTTECFDLKMDDIGYFKRIQYSSYADTLVLGRSDGLVVCVDAVSGVVIWTSQLSAAVRDLDFSLDQKSVFVALEDGNVVQIDAAGGQVQSTHQGDEPIWSLAINPYSGLVAAFERYGQILFLNNENKIVDRHPNAGRAKRAKWIDRNLLLHSTGAEIFSYDLSSKKHQCVVERAGNTIEDFIWDRGRNYFLTISYLNLIGLYDMRNWQELCCVPDQIDYSKGLAWVPSPEIHQPFEFVTFGRSGNLHRFRVHNEMVVALGPIPNSHSTRRKPLTTQPSMAGAN